MGIFDIFKAKPEPNEKNDPERLKNLVLLTELNINPYDYNHDDLERFEIGLSEELDGDIKTSEKTYFEGENEFDYISLTDRTLDRKSLFKSKLNPDERKIQEIVDNYYEVLGKDFVKEKQFSSTDLYNYQEQESGHLRTWYPFNFEVILGFNSNKMGKSLFVLVQER
ncbi:hypothetical protein [Salegentibacter maritimus]|uniref:Uncharacterized protein n=1 Tax=Salegentibacter maritimus TaxID=2794347 RepID=A0ABS0TML4_9FLAO|nr:hypothetical protein [Salegentibacter maritimus]MBI6121248.1 hypothetical protein [Salegentibacter maritimus]